LGGEQWSAELAPGEAPLEKGTRVQVVSVQGLKLIVRKASE
jgi:membrane protein implicated in regulation of membrane protease activity